MEDPESDATDPTAPGKDPPGGLDPEPEVVGAVVDDDAEAVEPPPPQAARMTARESPAPRNATRRGKWKLRCLMMCLLR
ncbi:MAG: hypothetical protein QOK39_1195 [Acidimicrobiaceae bacterium]|jgi:hypothetical protein|nr:hypothetical protein [Acidimicrobiaceae bacterium]